MKDLILYTLIAVIALAFAPIVAAKTKDLILGDPGLIKLSKQHRAVACLMSNDAVPSKYSDRIATLNNALRDAMEQAETITNLALAENRDMTPEENTAHGTFMASFENAKNEVKRLEVMESNNAFMAESGNPGGAPAPQPIDPQNTGGAPVAHQHQAPGHAGRIETPNNLRNSNGFRHFGEFAKAVINGAVKNGGQPTIDPRLLVNAPTTYSQEGVGADGGFLVPAEYRDAIMKQVMGEDALLSMCDEFSTARNSIVVPQDITNPSGSSGIQAYWEGEASQLTQSKPVFKDKQARLNKLTALVPVTEEMLEDSPLIGSYLTNKAPEVITAKVNDAIVNGTGAGMPQGFMNSGALITVVKEGSQVADTVVSENISKMWSRMYAPYRRDAVWLINQDVEPTLDDMSVKVKNVAGTENVGGLPVYMPAGGLSDAPYGRLKGRPVIPVEAMQTLGDLGDIALVSLSQYMAAVKAGGVQSDVSMHLWFDYDMACFKFRFRMAGSPWFDNTITPANSTNTLSPFVTLAART